MKYTVLSFGLFRGRRWNHEKYTEYLEKIDSELSIFDSGFTEEEEKMIIEALEKSLENKKDFYFNASEKIKNQMELYEKLLDEEAML